MEISDQYRSWPSPCLAVFRPKITMEDFLSTGLCPKATQELVAWFLDQTKEAGTPDESGWTPLIIAASAGHSDLLKLLLDKGAEVNRTTEQGRTALLYAASKGRTELVAELINMGTDVRSQIS